MPPLPGNPKVEELRFRLKTDPKSRLFFPLAEELRKINQFGEAEQVLRTGLNHHPTYLSAWVSLGRVLRDEGKHGDAIEPLAKALQLDPGNVVAARLLADAYLSTGETLEAVKKYKLVLALMPGDNDLRAHVEQLERELNPIAPVPLSEEESGGQALMPVPEVIDEEPLPEPIPFPTEEVAAPQPPAPEAAAPFDTAIEHAHDVFVEEQREDVATGDDEPMHAAHDASPFEDAVADFSAAAVEIEAPMGIHVEEAPLGAETASLWAEEEPLETVEPVEPAEPTETVTMADLYASQGLTDDARRIYEHLLQRDPDNDALRAKLAALDEAPAAPSPAAQRSAKVAKLEGWLAKVARREVTGDV